MDFRRLFNIFHYQLGRYPQKIALAHLEEGKWQKFSTQACIDLINEISAGLLDLGLSKGDKVGLLFESGSAYFNFLDFGLLQIGVITVPIHSNVPQEELTYILKDAEIKICFTSTEKLYRKVAQLSDQIVSLKNIFCLEQFDDVPYWKDIIKHVDDEHMAIFNDMKSVIHEEDIATIMYTSGTSGMPKGVMLTHKNIVSNIKSIISLIPINCDKRVVSFLPLSHIFERMVTFTYIAAGASIYYVEQGENVIKTLKEIKPHYFTSVPKLLERIYVGILDRGNQRGKFGKAVLNWSLSLGERYKGKRGMNPFYYLKLRLADILVYRQWRNALGGRVEGVVVGAAALQPKLGRLFSAAGIEIREGYGLTETSPVIAFNRFEPGGVQFGTVGIPIPGVRIKIDDPDENGAGEIFVKGPGVMLGYHKKEALTKEVIDEDGWFHTGDIGKMVHKRFLKITDRKKDIFKTSSGKYIAPQILENLLNSSPYIEHSLITGFNKPHVGALVVPDFDRLKTWCETHNVHWTAPQYMAINPKIIKFMAEIIQELNEKVTSTEKVKQFVLLYEPWTVEAGEITPTLKLKRTAIAKKYQKEIDGLFS
ncbi:MAG: long-chain acyl-CoA synthetase [Saprospiraceae bacterium]|jgi:long-chain acyl-CoA synthetase